MTANIAPLIAGNWKMNGLLASLSEVTKLAGLLAKGVPPRCMVAICPPATLIGPMNAIAAPAGIVVGGQDCATGVSGAHTGDISAIMLRDCGAQMVIVGHSERRADHGETDEIVYTKADAALAAGLTPIICVGETRAEREAGRAIDVVTRQLGQSVPESAGGNDFVIAYEPVWAIGTGLTPTSADIAEIHGALRNLLVKRLGEQGAGVRILYGGSLKPGNARDILAIPNVNGGLIGGASLLADDLYAIICAG